MRVPSLLLLLALALPGCAGTPEKTTPVPAPESQAALPAGKQIGAVEVVLDRDSVPQNGIDAAERYDIPAKLQSRVTALLGARFAADGELVVHVSIGNFRLRSGGNAFWLGAMGGADMLEVSVEVVDGGTPLKHFETDTSTVLGGIAYASPTRRSARLVQSISERIVAGL